MQPMKYFDAKKVKKNADLKQSGNEINKIHPAYYISLLF